MAIGIEPLWIQRKGSPLLASTLDKPSVRLQSTPVRRWPSSIRPWWFLARDGRIELVHDGASSRACMLARISSWRLTGWNAASAGNRCSRAVRNHSRCVQIKQRAFPTRGHFTEVTAAGSVDPENPTASSVDLTINSVNANTNHAARANDLRSSSLLETDKYPTIASKKTSIQSES
jgi:YceI-like domain